MRNSVVPVTLYVQGALGNTLLYVMQNKVSTYSTNIPKKLCYSYKPLYLDSKGRCKIQTACRVHHDEFLGPAESCSESWLHTSCSCCHLKELFATLSIYAVIYM